ncbi:hypothetical protein JCGZ_17057 [Jatropha curcas]|uniref:Uncharacterized protein n=1 Tax=Jatropha curcas TaxID=180498 RepID=A0A067K646_JATCU|nr:hypothetical protein JCGZ_17057 [Jatropha curcas]
MAESSSTSSSDSLTEQELQLLKRLSKKYEQKESKQKKPEEEPKEGKIETATSEKQVARACDKGKSVLSPYPLMRSYVIDWKFFGSNEFDFKELFEFQGWMSFLSLNRLCYESLVKEFYGSLKVSGIESISIKLKGEIKALSYADLSKIFYFPNAGSRVTKIKDISRENDGYNVSKLDSGSLKMKDEEGEEEKEKEEKRKEGTEKEEKGRKEAEKEKKPKKVKHTAGKHRTHGRKPPLHPSSKRPESSFETTPAQNLRSSKRLRTDPKPL